MDSRKVTRAILFAISLIVTPGLVHELRAQKPKLIEPDSIVCGILRRLHHFTNDSLVYELHVSEKSDSSAFFALRKPPQHILIIGNQYRLGYVRGRLVEVQFKKSCKPEQPFLIRASLDRPPTR